MGDGLESLKSKVLKRFALIGIVGTLIISITMSAILFESDREHIYRDARESAQLIKTGLLSAMMSTGNPAVVRATVDYYKKVVKFNFRMVRSRHIQKQFGIREGETPKDDVEWAVLTGKRDDYSSIEGTNFRLVFPFVADERCGKCHNLTDNGPVPSGTVLGLSELVIDVREWRNASLWVVAKGVAGIVLILLAIGGIVFLVFNREVIGPVHKIASAMEVAGREGTIPALPPANSRELAVLSRQLNRMAKAMHDKFIAHQKAADEERRKMEQIKKFALQQAGNLGLTDQAEVGIIIRRLSEAVREVEKNEMLMLVCGFVTTERKELELHNDAALIRAASLYLTDLIANTRGNVKKGSMELALEEAVTNAIVHGNLEVDSSLKETDFEMFEREVKERREREPYKSRTVKITYDYDKSRAVFRIEDMGRGFNWREFLRKDTDPALLPHGRGIIIIRAFASSVEYNEAGNAVTLGFDLA